MLLVFRAFLSDLFLSLKTNYPPFIILRTQHLNRQSDDDDDSCITTTTTRNEYRDTKHTAQLVARSRERRNIGQSSFGNTCRLLPLRQPNPKPFISAFEWATTYETTNDSNLSISTSPSNVLHSLVFLFLRLASDKA